jgi:putative endonuclease
MYIVYALCNKKHKKIYIGQTKDWGEREFLHDNKIFKDSYTARFDGEWQLIYSEDVGTRQEALKREKQLKSYQGRQFVKKNIRE